MCIRDRLCYLLNEISGEILTEAQCPYPDRDYGGRRILLVEDNDINREIARILLEERGIRVEEACDGVQAVRMVSDCLLYTSRSPGRRRFWSGWNMWVSAGRTCIIMRRGPSGTMWWSRPLCWGMNRGALWWRLEAG